MPKRAKDLPPVTVQRLSKRPGFHAVGGVAGLHLQVTKSKGSSPAASWILRVKIGDKRPDLGLGSYPTVLLADARNAAREARALIDKGIDPRIAKQEAKAALSAAQAKALNFEQAAVLCHKAKRSEFRNPKHSEQWINTLKTYAVPVIGRIPVADIELPHIVSVLEPIWETKTETATRVRQRIESVLAWSTVSGFRAGDNPARWKGNLEHALPKPSKLRKTKHHPALPWQTVPEFMVDLRGRDGMATRALEFLILTAARSGEVRLAKWREIDLDAKVWTVPADRMKAGLRHRVPLSAPAIKLLKALPRMQGVPYVFAAPRGGALSDMAISAVTRRMHEASIDAGGDGYPDPRQDRVATPHGFRSSFKDWARSSTSYADEVSELALAHVSSDDTRAAYARDELLPKRERLMRDWAKFCGAVRKSASVTDIGGRRG